MPHDPTRRSLLLIGAVLASPSLLLAAAKPPRTSFQDVEWQVATIGGTPVIDGSEVTILFEKGGGFGGRACNRFSGSYEVDRDKIRLGPAATTRMACAQPLMVQESALFDALEKVASWRVGEDGSFTLADKDGAALLVARQ